MGELLEGQMEEPRPTVQDWSVRLLPSQEQVTRNKLGRIICRSEYQDVVDRLRARLKSEEGQDKLNKRREVLEHPFGTMTRPFNQAYLLPKA